MKIWDRRKKQRKVRVMSGGYLLRYSLMMAVLFSIAFLWFVYYGKSFVWRKDGYSQHYAALFYYGEYLRGIVKNLFVSHRLEIPLWDMNIGYGSDILTTLHYYVVGDPLALCSVFVPGAYTEYLYTGLILLRIYLAGLSFSYFSLSHGNRQSSVLLGSVCYCFCGYVLKVAVRHPYFMNPMIYLPLLLLGVDRIYQRKKPFLYIVMVALAGVSNVYFLYMLGILVVLYAGARYLEFSCGFGPGKIRLGLRDFWGLLGRFTGYSLLGLAMAAVILLPVANSMLQADRMGIDFYLPPFYTEDYYKELFLNFTSGGGKEYSYLGYGAIGFLAVVSLYLSKGKNTLLKILFPVMTIFLCVPFIGHVFNGFSYRTNRWVFGYSMLVAYIVVKADFFHLSPRGKRLLAFWAALYGVLCLWISSGEEIAVRVALLAVCCLSLFAGGVFLKGRGRGIMLSVLSGLCVFFQAYYLYTPAGDNYQEEFVPAGRCYGMIFEESPEAGACQMMDGAYRFDKSRYISRSNEGYEMNINVAMLLKKPGISYYFSLDHPAVSDFLKEMQLNTTSAHRYRDLESRNILETVSSVKYFLAGRQQKAKVPALYRDKPVYDGEDYRVYQGEDALPIGYTYDGYIPREVYSRLSAVKKQQALLQGCVVEESSLPQVEPLFCHQTASVQIRAGDGIVLRENGIQVNKKGARMALCCQGTVPGELYAVFAGLTYQHEEKHEVRIEFQANQKRSTLILKNDKDNFYSGFSDFIVNLGEMKRKVTEIEVCFSDTGVYQYDGLSVVCQPMDKQIEYTRERGREVLTDVVFSANQVKGRILLPEKRLLFLSIPYSTGWRAYADGEEVTVKRANTFGMALELPKGEHQITLKYGTPCLGLGTGLSAVGWLVFLGMCFCWKRIFPEAHHSYHMKSMPQ